MVPVGWCITALEITRQADLGPSKSKAFLADGQPHPQNVVLPAATNPVIGNCLDLVAR